MDRINQRTNHLLGYNIKLLRIEHKLRNKDIIAQLQLRGIDISSSTYAKMESGVNNPSVDLIMALKAIYDCDYSDFFKEL